MVGNDFQRRYEQLTDNELGQVITAKQDLVPAAAEALNAEVKRRRYVAPAPVEWTPQSGSDLKVSSLEDYKDYRDLARRRKSLNSFGYLLALGPFIAGLVLGRRFFENSTVLVSATLIWAICVAVYGLIVNLRFLGFKCPQCMQSFGRGGECFNCGFPRSAVK